MALVVVALLFAAWRLVGGGDDAPPAAAAAEDPKLLYNRVWIDSKPERYVDYQQAFLILDFAPICMFQKASAYDVHLEICEHKGKDGVVDVFFPQTDRKARMRYKVSRCDELPPFDLCLDVKPNPWRGPKRYYSSTDPDDQALADLKRPMLQRLE